MSKRVLLILAGALICLGLSATVWFLRSPSSPGLPKIRLGINRYTGDLPFFVAVEKKYFQDEGLEPVITEFGDSSESLNALLADQVDVINPISFSALLEVEARSPGTLRLFLPGGEDQDIIGSYLLVRRSSPIQTLQDLRGKKIGTYTGVTQMLYLKLFLERVGMNPDTDVEIIQVGFNLQVQALEAGQFDALFTIEPTGTIALAKTDVRVLVANPRVKYIVDPFISGAAAIPQSLLRDKPDEVRRTIRAADRGLDFVRTHEQEARLILAKYAALDQEIGTRVPLLLWYSLRDQFDPRPVQTLADLLAGHEILPKRVEVARLFLREADFGIPQ